MKEEMIKAEYGEKDTGKKYYELSNIIQRLRKALLKEYRRKGYGIEYSQRKIEHIIKGDKEYD